MINGYCQLPDDVMDIIDRILTNEEYGADVTLPGVYDKVQRVLETNKPIVFPRFKIGSSYEYRELIRVSLIPNLRVTYFDFKMRDLAYRVRFSANNISINIVQ